MKYVLYTLVNWINYETMVSSKKFSDRFKRGNSSKILFLWNPNKIPNERKKTEFSKNVKN